MTAPLFHMSPGELDSAAVGSTVYLSGAEAHHAVTVMRLRAGEMIQLSDTLDRRAEGVVISAESQQLSVEVTAVHQEAAQLPKLVLVQALAKDRRDQQAVESATELGVDAVIPWTAERSVARWKTGREAKKHAEWVSLSTAAAKQTRRTSLPQVRELQSTSQYVRSLQDQPQIAVVVLHEAENQALRTALQQLGLLGESAAAQQGAQMEELHLVVGPEGGISDAELRKLRELGAQPARLGPNVLRSSTAGPAAIAAAQLLLGRWETAAPVSGSPQQDR